MFACSAALRPDADPAGQPNRSPIRRPVRDVPRPKWKPAPAARWPWQSWNGLTTNDTSVKAAFAQAARPAAAATVRILADGKPAALGTVVDAGGHVVTKASLLEGELTCRIADGREVEARIVGSNEDYDIALLKIAAAGLTPVIWRSAPAPPGIFVAAVEPGDGLLGIGVVSAEPRKIRGSTRPQNRRGWLGIGLGDHPAGLGITSVAGGSPAEKAGLEVGDRVESINGRAMASADEVVQTVGGHAPGERLRMVVERGGEEREIEAVLGKPEPRREPQDHWGGGPFSERRWGFPLALPHDVVIHPKDCGGPLIDTDGNAVGINIARALRVASYAIPADAVQTVIAEWLGRRGKSAWAPRRR